MEAPLQLHPLGYIHHKDSVFLPAPELLKTNQFQLNQSPFLHTLHKVHNPNQQLYLLSGAT
jgi:hypothetical protein